ncbi:MAG: YbaK/EbsC family protein [Desulfobacterales bacterium]
MPPKTLTSADLQTFIAERGIDATILPMAAHTSTVDDAARELKVAAEQVIKSLVFVIEDRPLLVINNGTARVDRKKLAMFLGVGRKRVRFADADQALAMTGYVVGSMPPFGHLQALRTLVAPAIPRLDLVYGGGGDIDAMLRLRPAELLRVTASQVFDISE